ncbi:hypothetical protein K402DRAFT_7939 [Aulographum hederae CBS 113979]|uniref:Uncharacterized protein n=1 Tax=Aulographum hederae CBS 113979 TaxID=1176131 RepID=A0A6G1HHK9_9PEZI|nr:hypothetical protein K402DRAFT_7939 [Aulographum hederae CBS 113979]
MKNTTFVLQFACSLYETRSNGRIPEVEVVSRYRILIDRAIPSMNLSNSTCINPRNITFFTCQESSDPRGPGRESYILLNLLQKLFETLLELHLDSDVHKLLVVLIRESERASENNLKLVLVPFLHFLVSNSERLGISLSRFLYEHFFQRVMDAYIKRYVRQEPVLVEQGRGKKLERERITRQYDAAVKSWKLRAEEAQREIWRFDQTKLRALLGENYSRISDMRDVRLEFQAQRPPLPPFYLPTNHPAFGGRGRYERPTAAAGNTRLQSQATYQARPSLTEISRSISEQFSQQKVGTKRKAESQIVDLTQD